MATTDGGRATVPGTADSPLAGLRPAELLDQVQERLDALSRDQTRVQSLLDAFLSVSTGLDLERTLKRIVEAATHLVHARYGALGVLAPGGGLAAFIHVGIEEEQATTMGPLPGGRGVLGQLISEPYPLRIADLGGHPSSVGFPLNHPQMRSFLGVPLLVRGQVFGNLYLTEKRHGEFTVEDETVLTALAGAAGIAIENARLYEESEGRRRWMAAVADVRAALLNASSSDEAFRLIAERVAGLTDADGAWILDVPGAAAGSYEVVVQVGEDLEGSEGRRLADCDGPALQAATAGTGVVTLDLSGPSSAGNDGRVGWGPCLAVRLPRREGDDALLVAARRAGAPAFDESVIPYVTTFAEQAALALDMAAQQQAERRLDVYRDRDRIARDLHDHVIQRVFAAGLTVQAVLPRIPELEARRRIREVVVQLDETVRDIRTTIFDLHTADEAASRDSLRRRVLDTVTETAGPDLRPIVRLSGPVDSLLSGALAADVEAVAREAVSNAARHSGAASVTVTLDVTEDVVLEVVDDGRGIDPHAARSGLRNLADRARRRGGELLVEPVRDGGTRVRWWAPVR